jgi:3-oxoacyl-[acyl-carrier protein] reductase
LDLQGKVAIVTGSSSPEGVGGEIAKALAARGCKVTVNFASNRAGADKVVAACVAAGSEAIAAQGDVAADADCRRLVSATIERWNRLDVLVNNAAVTRAVPFDDLEALDAD